MEMKEADLKGLREAYYGELLCKYIEEDGNIDRTRL